jgi:hypothetical protein
MNILKKILTLILIAALVFFGFVGYKVFFTQKVDFRPIDQIITNFEKISTTSLVQTQVKVFEIEEENCNLTATLEGIEFVEKFKIRAFYKASLLQNAETKQDSKYRIKCVEFAIKNFLFIFESKKTKQEFLKLSKELFTEFKVKTSVQKQFLNKTIKMQNEKGDLVISIN